MAVPFSKVLLQELTQVDERRSQVLKTPRPAISPEHSPETQALKRDLTGMGISGGGIRSATFNLGLLQGLSEHGVLHQLDYLSTVSGGGYIGSWLHGVIKRLHGGRPDQAEEELSLASNPIPRAPADDPISFLRKYSNYLAPRPSLLSTDVWVIAAIWVRNIFLNWCVLIPFLAALLLLPVAGGLAQQAFDTDKDHERLLELSFFPALALLSLAVIIMGKRLREIAQRTFPDQRSGRKESQPGIDRIRKADAGFCAVFVFLGSRTHGCNTPRSFALALVGINGWSSRPAGAVSRTHDTRRVPEVLRFPSRRPCCRRFRVGFALFDYMRRGHCRSSHRDIVLAW